MFEPLPVGIERASRQVHDDSPNWLARSLAPAGNGDLLLILDGDDLRVA
jgi:hypothetical protein